MSQTKDLFFNCEKSCLEEIYNCKYCKTNSLILFCGHSQKFLINKKNPTSVSAECYTCQNCNFLTFSLLILFKHNLSCQDNSKNKKPTNTTTSPKYYQCPYCPHKVTRGWTLKGHITRKHTAPEKIKWFECDQCDYKAKVKVDLKLHKKIHKSDEELSLYYCTHCDFKCRAPSNIKRHILTKHSAPESIPKFECATCKYTTIRKDDLKRHIIVHHTAPEAIEWYYCEQCNYRNKIKSELKRHVKVHHMPIKFFYCDRCEYKAKRNSLLKRHILLKHP